MDVTGPGFVVAVLAGLFAVFFTLHLASHGPSETSGWLFAGQLTALLALPFVYLARRRPAE